VGARSIAIVGWGLALALAAGAGAPAPARAATVALWLFDEAEGVAPGSLLTDAGPDGHFLVLGRGGRLEPGRFGRALRVVPPGPLPPLEALAAGLDEDDAVRSGLRPPPDPAPDRAVEPMTWANAHFAAALVHGEPHLRGAPTTHPTASALNLGGGDFTVEAWLRLDPGAAGEGVLLELGSGPRGGEAPVTRLSLHPAEGRFELVNTPSETRLAIPTDAGALADAWAHVAFAYDAQRGVLRHFVDGRLQGAPLRVRLAPLPPGAGDYASIGRDGRWERPLPGAVDELRVSDAALYAADFAPPGSLSRRAGAPPPPPPSGPPLRFPDGRSPPRTIELGGDKHVFLDDALLARHEHLRFQAHPARLEEVVLEADVGWASVVEDEAGRVRLYGECPGGTCLWLAEDGVHFAPWEGPGGRGPLVAADPARRGSVYLDPSAPPAERWKLLSGSAERGLWLHTSADGLAFTRNEVTALPFAAGSAPTAWVDDQRGLTVAHLRSDAGRTAAGRTERSFLRAETDDPLRPWPFTPLPTRHGDASEADDRVAWWWLDNGPLAPAGPSRELPVALARDPHLDPEATDLYNTRALKYPWAPDAYLAFPLWYFHYERAAPPARAALAAPERGRGSGVVEVQLATSRDGLRWTRHPRPAYVPIGEHRGYPIRRPYIAFGLVRRGAELWQYVYSRSSPHSPHGPAPRPPVVHRLVQRLDGFVSADAPYDREATLVTHPLRFAGGQLVLNVDTGATGWAQVGFLDERGQPVPGYGVDDCVYVNGNEVAYPVEWLAQGRDVSPLAGRTVQLVIRMRGASLYALQFVPAEAPAPLTPTAAASRSAPPPP
jgi:hypothetical protein